VLLAGQLILEQPLDSKVWEKTGREQYSRAAANASGLRRCLMRSAEDIAEFAAPR